MALPKSKITRAKAKMKRNYSFRIKKIPSLVKCSNCNEMKRNHAVCTHCGFYKGEKILDVKKNKKK